MPASATARSDLALAEPVAAAAARIARNCRRGLRVFSSPLRRCRTRRLPAPGAADDDPRLREMDFGAWEMTPWAVSSARHSTAGPPIRSAIGRRKANRSANCNNGYGTSSPKHAATASNAPHWSPTPA
jgi:hypothetical protein